MFDSVRCGPPPAAAATTNGTQAQHHDSSSHTTPNGTTAANGDGQHGAQQRQYAFDLLFSKCVDAYVELKHNQNQICWKWCKVEVAEHDSPHTLRHFLDGRQYSMSGVCACVPCVRRAAVQHVGWDTLQCITWNGAV